MKKPGKGEKKGNKPFNPKSTNRGSNPKGGAQTTKIIKHTPRGR